MLEHFYASSFIYYLLPSDHLALVMILGEIAGFFIIANVTINKTPWFLWFPSILVSGFVWILFWESLCFMVVFRLGLLKGV